MTFRNILAVAGCLALLGTGLAHAELSAPEALAARQAGMKENGRDAAAIKKAIETGGDLGALAPRAAEIAAFASKLPGLFPPGSDQGKTRALPAVWADKADFDKQAAALATHARALETALKANDPTKAKAAFGAAAGTCGACHRTYRRPA